ncbi:hypothetical protein BDF19DRAFT_255593 [Syncephalis fuscata]|nr:hypothetical protein BDF19DRAFT_255593 [Syncephalis fuscata]
MTRCQSVPDFMAHRTTEATLIRPSLSRMATTTAVTLWPNMTAAPLHSMSTSNALPLLPQSQPSNQLPTASLIHSGNLISSMEQQSLPLDHMTYNAPPYTPTGNIQLPYYQHGIEANDPMMWSEELRTGHGLGPSASTPTAVTFAQNAAHTGNHNVSFPIPIRQRELPSHGSYHSGNSSGGGSNNSIESKQCEQCGTMRSPEWRRGPSGHKT